MPIAICFGNIAISLKPQQFRIYAKHLRKTIHGKFTEFNSQLVQIPHVKCEISITFVCLYICTTNYFHSTKVPSSQIVHWVDLICTWKSFSTSLHFTHSEFWLFPQNTSILFKMIGFEMKKHRSHECAHKRLYFVCKRTLGGGKHEIAILWTEWHDICIIKTIKIHAYCSVPSTMVYSPSKTQPQHLTIYRNLIYAFIQHNIRYAME